MAGVCRTGARSQERVGRWHDRARRISNGVTQRRRKQREACASQASDEHAATRPDRRQHRCEGRRRGCAENHDPQAASGFDSFDGQGTRAPRLKTALHNDQRNGQNAAEARTPHAAQANRSTAQNGTGRRPQCRGAALSPTAVSGPARERFDTDAGQRLTLTPDSERASASTVIDAHGAPKVDHVDFNVTVGTLVPRSGIHSDPGPRDPDPDRCGMARFSLFRRSETKSLSSIRAI